MAITDFRVKNNAIVEGGKLGVSQTSQHTIPSSTSDTFTLNDATQTLKNKTVEAPSLTGTINASTATWSNLGAVTTVDINGGTVDGVQIGETTRSSGKFTTLDANGNVVIGDSSSDTVTIQSSFVTGTQLKTATSSSNTLSLSAYDVDGAAYANLVTITAGNTPTLALSSVGVGSMDNVVIGATTPTSATFTTLSATSLNVPALTIGNLNSDATLSTNGTGDLILNTNTGTNSGFIRIYDGVNGDIEVSPNGTGDLLVVADTLRLGDPSSATTLTTNGAGALTVTTGGGANLTLSTNSGSNSGVISITNGVNGTIRITPNGTGVVETGPVVVNKTGTASVGTQLFDSNSLSLRGSYWNGSAASDYDMTILHDLTTTGTTPVSKFSLLFGGVERFSVNNSGSLVITGTFTTGGIDTTTLAVSGATTFSNTVSINTPSLSTNQTTFNLVNTTATTLNIGGAALTTTIGNSSGTVIIPGVLSAGSLSFPANQQGTGVTEFPLAGQLGTAAFVNVDQLYWYASLSNTPDAVNTMNVYGSVTNQPVDIKAEGNDANISIRLSPKGTGGVEFDNITLKSFGSTVVNNTTGIIDSFPLATFGSAEYQVQVTSGSNRHVTKLLVAHDGTNTHIIEYGTVYSSNLGTIVADINGSNIEVKWTTTANTSIKWVSEKVRV